MTKQLREEYYDDSYKFLGTNRKREVIGNLLDTNDFSYVHLNRDNSNDSNSSNEIQILDAWAAEHLTGEYIVFRNCGYFVNEEDAILFKMTWYRATEMCE